MSVVSVDEGDDAEAAIIAFVVAAVIEFVVDDEA